MWAFMIHPLKTQCMNPTAYLSSALPHLAAWSLACSAVTQLVLAAKTPNPPRTSHDHISSRGSSTISVSRSASAPWLLTSVITMDCLPIPFVCIQCGTDQNPCHIKVIGPTLGKYSRGLKLGRLLTTFRFLCWDCLCCMPWEDWVLLKLLGAHAFLGVLLAGSAVLWMLCNRDREAVRSETLSA